MIGKEGKEIKSPKTKCIDINGNFCMVNKLVRRGSNKELKDSINNSKQKCGNEKCNAMVTSEEIKMQEERRRKLEERLRQLAEREGGALKIYGGACLNPMLPYKVLLVDRSDSAETVLREVLEKYGETEANTHEFCLVLRRQRDGTIYRSLGTRESPLSALMALDVGPENKEVSQIRLEVARRPQRQSRSRERQRQRKEEKVKKVANVGMALPKYEEVVKKQAQPQLRLQSKSQPQPPPPVPGVPPHQTKTSASSIVTKKPQIIDTDTNSDTQTNGISQYLPIQLTYFKSKEKELIESIIGANPVSEFRLSSAYTLHLMVIDNLVQEGSVNVAALNRLVSYMAVVMRTAVLLRCQIVAVQAYWLANSTEFLHLLINNKLLSSLPQSVRLQFYELFAETAQITFSNISDHFRNDMVEVIPILFCYDEEADDECDQDDAPLPQKPNSKVPKVSIVIRTLSSCLGLLRQHQINSALLIQLMAHLLHCLAAHTLRHQLNAEPNWQEANLLKQRLIRIRSWAARNELDLAADCYLEAPLEMCRLQLALLHQDGYYVHCNRTELAVAAANDLESLYAICTELIHLNSLQIRHVLQKITTIPNIWIDFTVSGVSEVADQCMKETGQEVTLYPSEELALPLLLPEDGYCVETLHSGIPSGLVKFLNQLNKSWCFYKVFDQHTAKDHFFDWLVDFPVSTKDDRNSDSIEDAFDYSKYTCLEEQIMESAAVTKPDHSKRSCYRKNDQHKLDLENFKLSTVAQRGIVTDEQSVDSALESGMETDKYTVQSYSGNRYEDSVTGWRDGDRISIGDGVGNIVDNNRDVIGVYAPPINVRNLYPSEEASSDGGCSTTAPSLLSDLTGDMRHSHPTYSGVTINTLAGHLMGVRDLQNNVEHGLQQIGEAIDQFQVVEERLTRVYEKKLELKMTEYHKTRNQDLLALTKQEHRKIEMINLQSHKLQNQRNIDRDIQQERMKHIRVLETCKQSRPATPNDCSQYFVPINCVPANVQCHCDNNEITYFPVEDGRKLSRSHSVAEHLLNRYSPSDDQEHCFTSNRRPPRSLSNDRYHTLLTTDVDRLTFEEKRDLFEFGISRNAH